MAVRKMIGNGANRRNADERKERVRLRYLLSRMLTGRALAKAPGIKMRKGVRELREIEAEKRAMPPEEARACGPVDHRGESSRKVVGHQRIPIRNVESIWRGKSIQSRQHGFIRGR
jgi:hypothetical protein